MPGCSPLIRDPNGVMWALGINNSGQLTLTNTANNPFYFENLVLKGGSNSYWQFTVDSQGRLVLTKIATPTSSHRALNYAALQNAAGAFWRLTVNGSGQLIATAVAGSLMDDIPYIVDVTMSAWPVNIGVICMRCNNATVHVSADLSCWCCSCNAFVDDSETNLIVILDE